MRNRNTHRLHGPIEFRIVTKHLAPGLSSPRRQTPLQLVSTLETLIQNRQVIRHSLRVRESLRKFVQPFAGLCKDIDIGNQIDIRLAPRQFLDDPVELGGLFKNLGVLLVRELNSRSATPLRRLRNQRHQTKKGNNEYSHHAYHMRIASCTQPPPHSAFAPSLCTQPCTQPLHSAPALSLCTQPLHSASTLSLCTQPLHSAPALSLCTQPMHSASALSLCTQPLHSASALSLCTQPLHSASALSLCTPSLQPHLTFQPCTQPPSLCTKPLHSASA